MGTCGGASLKLAPDCCCVEWECADYSFCLHKRGTTTVYSASTSITWATDAIAVELKMWGHGGDGGDSSGAGEAAGGGGGGGYIRVFWQGSTSDIDIRVNDAANDYNSDAYQDADLIGVAYRGNHGGDGPNGAGGVVDTTHGTAEAGTNAMTEGLCIFDGGAGADGVDDDHAGGGGGGAGSLENGTGANNGTHGNGGVERGGDGGDATAAAGGSGDDYGGAGAGGYNNASGGSGGDGRIEVTFLYKVQLELTIDGAPGEVNVDCECEGDQFEHRTADWSQLDGTYTLEQDGAFTDSFSLVLVEACDSEATRTDGILIEWSNYGDCVDDVEQLELSYEAEWRVSLITVSLECVDDRMRIASIGFSVCVCGRQYVGGSWLDWSCTDAGAYPATLDTGCDMVAMGDHLKTVPPCVKDRDMQREVDWSVAYTYETPCGIAFQCDTPTTGTLTAAVVE